MSSKLLIFSAPSGSGKSTIVRYLMERELGLEFSISATSRKARRGEIDGRDYYFISPDEFRMKIDNNDFIEWEEVYPDHYYGTLRSELDRIWNKGNNAIFDIDVKGGLNLKKEFGSRALSLFVMPPSLEVLEERLRARATDNEEALKERMGKAKYEMTFASQFDHILINDSLDHAFADAENAVKKFLGK